MAKKAYKALGMNPSHYLNASILDKIYEYEEKLERAINGTASYSECLVIHEFIEVLKEIKNETGKLR